MLLNDDQMTKMEKKKSLVLWSKSKLPRKFYPTVICFGCCREC